MEFIRRLFYGNPNDIAICCPHSDENLPVPDIDSFITETYLRLTGKDYKVVRRDSTKKTQYNYGRRSMTMEEAVNKEIAKQSPIDIGKLEDLRKTIKQILEIPMPLVESTNNSLTPSIPAVDVKVYKQTLSMICYQLNKTIDFNSSERKYLSKKNAPDFLDALAFSLVSYLFYGSSYKLHDTNDILIGKLNLTKYVTCLKGEYWGDWDKICESGN